MIIDYRLLMEFINWYNEETQLSFTNYLKNKFGPLEKFAAYLARSTKHTEVQKKLKMIKMLTNSSKGLNQFSYNTLAVKPEFISKWYEKQN